MKVILDAMNGNKKAMLLIGTRLSFFYHGLQSNK